MNFIDSLIKLTRNGDIVWRSTSNPNSTLFSGEYTRHTVFFYSDADGTSDNSDLHITGIGTVRINLAEHTQLGCAVKTQISERLSAWMKALSEAAASLPEQDQPCPPIP